MDTKTLLFSFSGRINRAKYWLGTLILLIIGLVLGGFVFLIAAGGSGISLIILIPVGVVMFVIGLAIAVKRLHDRDKSGAWLLVYYVLPAVLDRVARALEGSGGELLLSVASLGISLWAVVELGFLRGTAGPNRYGPDPLTSAA